MNTDYPIEIFQAADGQVRLEVRLKDETVWLSQAQMVMLFGRDKSVMSRHLGNIFKEGELRPEAVVAKNATTAADGKNWIGSFFFLLYLQSHGLHNTPGGRPRFADNALVALALLIAESDPAHKELMIKLIQHLIGEES